MPEAPVITSDVDPAWFLAGFGVLALLAALRMACEAHVRRDLLPLVLVVGAPIAALNEPIFDWLGKIVYTDGATVAYTAFDREIPLFLVVGYIPWMAGLPYVISRLMAAGTSRATLHWIAFGSFVSVVIVETIGTTIEGWAYYGEEPMKWLGVAPEMAPVPIVCGLLIYVIGDLVRGWKRGFMIAIPFVSLPAVYAAAGAPIYIALYADLPPVVDYLASIATLVLCAVVVACATRAAELWRQSRGDSTSGSPPLMPIDMRYSMRSDSPGVSAKR